MSPDFLHNHPQFKQLIEITAVAQKIQEPSLVEKDYWIMHCLWGLQQLGFSFELKGGTSLSKGFGIVDRFSEDIDILIKPDEKLVGFKVYDGKNHNKDQHRDSRKNYYDWLATYLAGKIPGIVEVERDTHFDTPPNYRSGGIRLRYQPVFGQVEGVKEGILLEAGFDTTMPNVQKTITSWAFEHAASSKVPCIDNRALAVPCYDIRYTFVEKLQTVIRKFRQYKEGGTLQQNFLRHYYDIYRLLESKGVQDFIGTEPYNAHKKERFGSDDIKVSNSGAFKLEDKADRDRFEASYTRTRSLYYRGQPSLTAILERVAKYVDRL